MHAEELFHKALQKVCQIFVTALLQTMTKQQALHYASLKIDHYLLRAGGTRAIMTQILGGPEIARYE